MLFEEKYTEQVDALYNRFVFYQRGSVIPWSEIELCMGRGRIEEGGWQIIRRFRRRLRQDREIVTLPKDTVGLRLLTHEEAAREIPALRQKRAYRQVSRGLYETATIDGGALSDRLRLALAMQRQHLQAHRLHLGRSRREAVQIGRKSPTHPVRKMK